MQRRLTDEQRAELLALIGDVPEGATSKHPAALSLLEHVRGLRSVPWWARPLDVRLMFGDSSEVAAALDRLREWSSRDWPEGPPHGVPVDVGEDRGADGDSPHRNDGMGTRS